MHGQDSNATERQALLGSHALARRNLAAKGAWAADRSRERHGWRSISVWVRPSRHLAAPAILDWPIAVGQATQEVRRGYGRAIQTGIRALRPDAGIVLFLDGDGSDPPERIPDMVRPIAEGRADFVLGSRLRGAREKGSLSPQ